MKAANFFGLNSDSQLHTVVSQLRAILLTAFMLDYGSFLHSESALFWFSRNCSLFTCTKQSFRAQPHRATRQHNCHHSTRFFSLRDRRVCSLKRHARETYTCQPQAYPLLWLPTDKICCGLLLTKLSLLKIVKHTSPYENNKTNPTRQ